MSDSIVLRSVLDKLDELGGRLTRVDEHLDRLDGLVWDLSQASIDVFTSTTEVIHTFSKARESLRHELAEQVAREEVEAAAEPVSVPGPDDYAEFGWDDDEDEWEAFSSESLLSFLGQPLSEEEWLEFRSRPSEALQEEIEASLEEARVALRNVGDLLFWGLGEDTSDVDEVESRLNELAERTVARVSELLGLETTTMEREAIEL